LWGYVLLIDAPPSAVRAAAMASFCFLAPLAWRRADGLTAWTLTFLAVHLISPGNLLRAGSLLSFVVMLGILLFLEWSRSFSSRFLDLFGVTLAAWAAGVPLTAAFFGTLTPGGILANLLLIPAATISVGAGVLGALAGFLSETLAAHLNNAAALCTQAMVAVSWGIGRLPGANIETGPWRTWECAAWYLAILLSLWLIHRVASRRKRTV
jgi:competence protein ComEC